MKCDSMTLELDVNNSPFTKRQQDMTTLNSGRKSEHLSPGEKPRFPGKKSDQYLGPRRKGVIDHQFHKIAMTKRSLTP